MPLDQSSDNKLRVGNVTKVTLKRLHDEDDDPINGLTDITLSLKLKKTGDAVANAQNLPFAYVAASAGRYVAEIPANAALTFGETYTLVVQGTGYRDEIDLKAVRS